MKTDCHPLDLLFRESEQRFTDSLARYKERPSNGYYGKIKQVGTFPTGQGTTIKDQRLLRINTQPTMSWEGVQDGLCSTNLCETPPTARINQAGWEDVDITLQKGSFDTDWICLDSLTFRKFATEQLNHFVEGVQQKSANEWDDKLRVEYLNGVGNKLMPYVDATVITSGDCDCAPAECSDENVQADAWQWVRNSDVGGVPGQVNGNYILVNIDPTAANAWERIGLLTTDLLELAQLKLNYADENKPMIGEGVDLYDVVLPDVRMGRDLRAWEDEDMANVHSYGGYQPEMLKRTLGTKFVLRDSFSFRYDQFAAKFWPDTEYNTALVAQVGYAHNPVDPTTWPRLKRVYPYKEVINTNGGIKSVENPDYVKAPFGITTIMTPEVINYMGFPQIDNAAGAKKEAWGASINYAGKATWINPDEPCNRERNKGYWYVKFGLAVKPLRQEFGFAWLHRISSKIRVRGACCPIGTLPCSVPLVNDCFGTTGGTEAALSGLRGANSVVGYRGSF